MYKIKKNGGANFIHLYVFVSLKFVFITKQFGMCKKNMVFCQEIYRYKNLLYTIILI